MMMTCCTSHGAWAEQRMALFAVILFFEYILDSDSLLDCPDSVALETVLSTPA